MYSRIGLLGSLLALSMPVLGASVTLDTCEKPEAVSLEPVIKWHWSGSSVLPSHNQVMNTPVVVPLQDTNGDGKADGNDVPAVVFNTFRGGKYRGDGVLRAISGKDGSELWTVTDSDYRVYPGSSIAAADVDEDGFVEIFSATPNGVIAFEHTGEFKWETANLPSHLYMGIYIADLDADNSPEILAGNTVINADGSLKWQGTGYRGRNFANVADLNLDNIPEVILGASVYTNVGELLWRNSVVGDGFTAIGNFNTDDYPEIVLVSSSRVYLLSHQGELIWGPVWLPSGGAGGAPTIADMDGDNKVEIGVAGASNYVVIDTDGQILWTTPIEDKSSAVTGSSVFDFNGDGEADVVYNDEQFLRVYRGLDGAELFKISNTSGTAFELPVIVDVDNDNHADIVVASNSYAFGQQTGVIAFQGKDNNWMNTRNIWNQHAYSITNINDDGTVPAIPEPSWLTNNTFRSIPYLSESGDTCIRPATCKLYAIQDTKLNDTQFFTVSMVDSYGHDGTSDASSQAVELAHTDAYGNPSTVLEHTDAYGNIATHLGQSILTYEIAELGEVYTGYDIEAIAIHPTTNIIYVASGNNTAGDLPKGHLYALDAEIGKLFPIGATGFDEIGDLAFSPSGILYGYAKGQGITTIDVKTGRSELWIASEHMVEGLALAKVKDQTLFYGSVDTTLWTFDADSGELSIQCDNLLGETEALEMLNDSLMIFTTHQDNPPFIHFIDVNACEMLPDLQVSLDEFNDVEGLALPTAACQ